MKLADEIQKNINNNTYKACSLTDLLDAENVQLRLKTIILLQF
jgi:hypothetical protein